MKPWWQQRMCGFDLETTSPLPEEAKIVTASVALVGGGEPTEARDWLADPGVEIPEEATSVHGISTEQARADGRPLVEVVREVVELLTVHLAQRHALVIANARYDLTVLDRLCRQLGIPPLSERQVDLLVVDPFVIDKVLHCYRPSYVDERGRKLTPEQGQARGIPSSRTLEGMCMVYGATLDKAHAADADAIAAARLAWVMGAKADVIRRVRNEADARELAALKREWAAVRHDLPALHAAQVRWALAERVRFAEYKASVGDHEDAERIRMERGWPVLDLMPHELADAA